MSITIDYTDFSDYTKRKDKRENFPHKKLTYQIISAAMEVHKELGPGFLEKVYENALIVELLEVRRIPTEVQKSIPLLFYKGKRIGEHILDILVAGNVILEIKAVKELAPVHEAQLLSYLKATNCKVGLLLNFADKSLKYKRLIKD
ncbi:MAG: GxxExxY protein [Euryarchaeota archaeon]|nr:GxxExxY protein [Euryarchaeota archaeon]